MVPERNGDELSENFKTCAIWRLVCTRGLSSSSLNGSSNCTGFKRTQIFLLAQFIRSTFLHGKLQRWNWDRNPECLLSVADRFIVTKSIYFVFIAEFVERLPTIFPVNIWITYFFEIEHRWAKWFISDPSPKGTRWINDSMIRFKITQVSDPMDPCPEGIW